MVVERLNSNIASSTMFPDQERRATHLGGDATPEWHASVRQKPTHAPMLTTSSGTCPLTHGRTRAVDRIIDARGLSKKDHRRLSSKVVAMDDLDIDRPCVYGPLGLNGTGLRRHLGLVRP